MLLHPPEGGEKASLHTIKPGDHKRLIEWLGRRRIRAEACLGRPLQLAVCYEVGYDGFWLARLLLRTGVRTVVFDPASFLKPRRGRWAKTDRLDAEEMTRILRSQLERQQANLTSLRVRDLISDQEYLSDRRRISKECEATQQALAMLRSGNIFEPEQTAAEGCNRANLWFQEGNQQQKRQIVAALSSNLRLTDRKLSLKPFFRSL